MTPERIQQIQELYHAACENRAVLDHAGPELRREVESLLAQPSGNDGPLARPVIEVAADLLHEPEVDGLGPGVQLGPYKIESALGKGGMGEVWKARDPRLNRFVAIKRSHARFSERFAREAQAIAALNHPHICQIYDVGPDYLVMEYVQGQHLKGPLPLADVLRWASEMADALDAAHRKGITHRDLKPANILVCPSGVKILDFGLARMEHEPVADGPEILPLTGDGMIVGTLQYMSPEQIEGRKADARSDIFAFGLVLYEMLTGKLAFAGPTKTSLVASILTEQLPSIREMKPLTPVSLERLVLTCLEKDPEKRWQSAREIKRALEWIEADVGQGRARPESQATTAKSRTAWLIAGAAVIVAGVALWAPWRHDAAAQIDEPLVRIDADLGTGVSLFTDNGPAIALSHDGTRVAFSSRTEDGSMRLYWRRLDQATATPLPGTESGFSPFFSPNGEQIGFFAEGSLKRIELATGNVTVLANAVNPSGGTWGEDGVIIFHRAPSLDLWMVAANGGSIKPIPRPASESQARHWPQLLPGGKELLVTGVTGLGGNVDQDTVKTVSLEDGHSRTLVDGAHFGRYLSSGYLAYLRHGTLFVRAFDAARQELTGPEVPLLQGVEYSTLNGAGQFDIAANGTLIYRAARAGSELKTVQWMDSTGRLEPLLATPGDYRGIALSRDGKRLAMVIADGAATSDLYVYDIQRRQPPARLTVGVKINVEGGGGRGLAWNPDGRYLFFAAGRSTWWVPTEGLSQPREFVKTYTVSAISHDGTRLLAVTSTRETRGDAWMVPLSVGRDGPQAGRPEPLLREPYTEIPSDDSPDGRWLSYGTDETGIAQTYVMEFANPARKWMVPGGNGPPVSWSPSGREIFITTFFSPLRIMTASYSLEGGHFQPGQTRQWSPMAIPNHAGEGPATITMAPDGKRFAVLMPAEQPLGNRVTFVMNFFDEVRRKVPADK